MESSHDWFSRYSIQQFCIWLLRNYRIEEGSRSSRGWIGLRIVKRVDFFQFTVADMHAVEDLIHAKGCLHFKDCCDKISLDNMLLDLDAFDGWQNTRQESDHSVPPDQLSYAWPLKGNIGGEGYFGYILARQTSQIRLDNPESAETPKAARRRQPWLPKLDHNSLLDAEPPTRRRERRPR